MFRKPNLLCSASLTRTLTMMLVGVSALAAGQPGQGALAGLRGGWD